ncbi:MAG: hypothetical protein R3E12_10785 [Candidatus Eisenbacteria bacterium]
MIDPDPDRWRARLDHPGDRLVQEIDLPPGIDWDAVDAAEIQIDMLCSLNAHSAQPGSGVGPSARILLDGQVVASLPEEIPAAALDLDPRIFGVQDRFARVREAFSQHLEGFVNRRHPSAGFAYFPQWRRFAIDPHLLRGRTQARIEVVFEQGSGWIDVMGDGQVERLEAGSMGTRRLVRAPAFLTNAYDLSTHQFHTFASDRRRADVRLVRPLPLASPAARSLRAGRNGSPEPDLGRARGLPAGELRIRLRTRIDGTWVYRESARAATGDGILYATELQPGDEIVPETMLHNLAARRDTYFDGWITY